MSTPPAPTGRQTAEDADTYTGHQRRHHARELVTHWVDQAIADGTHPANLRRRDAITHGALCISGRVREAAAYLQRLLQRRQRAAMPVRCRARAPYRARPANRTTRSRRAPTAVRATADPDPEPPRLRRTSLAAEVLP